MKIVFAILFTFFTLMSIAVPDASIGGTTVALSAEEKAFIARHPEVVLGGGVSFEPFLIRSAGGSIAGFDVDVAALLKEKTGLSIAFALGVWSDVLGKADNREFDGLSTTGVIEERRARYNFSVPYVSFTSMVFVKKANSAGIYSERDFAGKHAALQEGNKLFAEILSSTSSRPQVTYYPRIDDVIRSVVSGQTDFTILDESALYVAGKMGLSSFLEPAFPLGEPFDIVFSLRNDWPELVSIVNKGLLSFTEHEKLSLRNKWFGTLSQEFTQGHQKLSFTREERDFIAAHPVIRMANETDWPPFDFNDAGGPRGLAIDYVQLLADRIGLEIEYVSGQSWSRLVELFRQKHIDVMPVFYRNSEREQYTLFTEPYYRGKLGIFTRSDNAQWSYNLKGRRVGMEKSHGSIPIVNRQLPGIHLVEVDSKVDLIRQLATKQLDAIIGNPLVFYYLARESQINTIQLSNYLTLNEEEQRQTSLHIGVRNDWPLLQQILQKAMGSVSDEEMAEIENRWADITIVETINWILVAEIAAGVMVLIIFLLWHNGRLNTKVAEKTHELKELNENLESLVRKRTKALVDVNAALNEKIAEIKTLRGIIPICSSCKNIRDGEGYWSQIESYIAAHSEAEFSHGICHDCARKLYPDLVDEDGKIY